MTKRAAKRCAAETGSGMGSGFHHRAFGRKRKRASLGLGLALIVTLCSPMATAQEAAPAAAQELTLGILVKEGATRTLEAWSPTVARLNALAEASGLGLTVKIEPHTRRSLEEELSLGRLDLVLSDPDQFVVAEVEQGARALLSAAQTREGIAYDMGGALAFVRRDSDIRSFADLAGKRVMGASADEVMGWQLLRLEARRQGTDLSREAGSVLFSGSNQREIVYAVQNGLVDAGVVRTGMLEQLAREGVISLADFRPVAPRSYQGFPFWGSTEIHPGSVLWAFPEVPEEALALVIDALLEGAGQGSGAGDGDIVWQAPQNYQGVHDMLIGMRARPYENYMMQAALRIYSTHKWAVWGLSAVILLSLLFLGHQVRRTWRVTEDSKDLLRSEIRSKQFYRNAVEEHTVFCMLDREGNISHVNGHLLSTVEGKRNDLLGSDFRALLGERDHERFGGEIMQALQAGASWGGDIQLRRTDGAPAWVNCTFIPIQSHKGRLTEVALVASDVSEIREKVTRKSLADTLELIRDQVVVLRPGTLDILYANSAAEEVLINARVGGDWEGKRAHDFIPPSALETLQEKIAEVAEAPARHISWEVAAKNNVTYEISLELAEPEDSEALLIAIYRDVSERTKVERTKKEFIATVSHELRTPLTSMKGALGLVASGRVGEVPPKIGKLVGMASSNCDRLADLIEDILDLDQITPEALRPRMQVLDLGELAAVALGRNEKLTAKHRVRLGRSGAEEGAALLTFGDPIRLMQVVENLLSNAVKFSNPGSEIELGLEDRGDHLRLTLQDRGLGIPARAQASIFDRFSQADSSDTRSKGGTGLGLSIVKLIVEAHEGRISFVSQEGVGTEFFIDLPKVEGERVLPLPAAPEGQQRADLEQFLKAAGREDAILIEGESAPPAERLMRLARDRGFRALRSEGTGTAGDLAAQLPEWLEEAAREDLLQWRAQAEGPARPLVTLELNHEARRNHGTAEQAGLMADLLRGWLNACTGLTSEGQAPRCAVHAGTDDLELLFAGAPLSTFADWTDRRLRLLEGSVDLIARPAFGQDLSAVALLPTAGADLPEDWPLILIGARAAQIRSGQGLVSKFSSLQSRGA